MKKKKKTQLNEAFWPQQSQEKPKKNKPQKKKRRNPVRTAFNGIINVHSARDIV